jgi:signal transduction histidine kinase
MILGIIALGSLAAGVAAAWTMQKAGRRRFVAAWNEKLEAEISDRRQIEQELAHLASFAEMAPNPIIEFLAGDKIAYTNDSARELFPDLNAAHFSHPLFAGLEAVAEKMRADRQVLHSRPIEINGRIYDERICLLDKGRTRLYLSDITELKRLDQLKTDFVNMTSHELRTPLTSIQGMVKIVAEGMAGDINDVQKKSLGIALRNIERLSRLINDLLDVSKIEAGNMTLSLEAVNLAELVRQVGDTFRPLIQERGLELRIQVASENLMVMMDRDRIIQVFTNFLHNAVKFTRRGFIDLIVQEEEFQVRCTVADTGPGITPSHLPRLFGKFQQAGSQSITGEKGSGLGLSLCKGLVELHGGAVWVESEVDKGSRFIFTLPREAV